MTSNSSKRRRLNRHSDDSPLSVKTLMSTSQLPSLEATYLNDQIEDGHEDDNKSTDECDSPQRVHASAARGISRDGDGDVAGGAFVGGSFKSSLFKLQVDELLSEMQPDYEKTLRGVDDALHRLKMLIEGTDDRSPLSVIEATQTLQKTHRITIPFPEPMTNQSSAYKLAYSRPCKINVVGGYALKTMIKSSIPSMDMVVVMPASLFQEKDYVNHRYFLKRAYYLACITASLQDSISERFDLEFDYLNGNNLHPILIVKPKSKTFKTTPDFEIRVIPSSLPTLFAASKLRPDKNSFRFKTLENSRISIPSFSPFYNASIRSDLSMESYHKLLYSAAKLSASFQEACILGRIWLRQRGFDSRLCNGGFGHFEWAVLMALLLTGGGPNGRPLFAAGYNSYQMFKAMLQFISTNDLTIKPFYYAMDDNSRFNSDTPMFYDSPREHNLLYKMTRWSYKLLQEDASMTLAMFSDGNFDPFESAFIINAAQHLHQFDCTFKIDCGLENSLRSIDHISASRERSIRLFDVLRQGLSDRVRLIHVREADTQRWAVKSSGPRTDDNTLSVSILFDPSHIDRLVDHGPPAEDKAKAAQFQKFWGEKAELRRFRNGSILESLIWSPGSTYTILAEILKYIITRHFGGESAASLKFIGDGLANLLPSFSISSKQFEALRQAYRIFENQMRDLEGLPLQIRSVSPSDSQLRSSSVHSPSFSSNKPLLKPANVLVQFEASGRWPDDIVAIQRTKSALLLKISSLLEKQEGVFATYPGLENDMHQLQNCAFLDVIYISGASFRLRIHHDREQGLLDRRIKNKSLDQRARDDAVYASSVYKRVYLQEQLLTQSISTHCTRFQMLSPTIRLAKLWFSRHMLSRHIKEEFIELLVAKVFLQPYPWREPSSAITGFLRTLLFLSRWDWRSTALIVDFTGTMTAQQITLINTRLEAWRKIDPNMNRTVVFAASNHDNSGTVYTDHSPSKVVAARMTALARSACKLVKDQGLALEPALLFTASTADYDFVIHLSCTSHRKEAVNESKFKNLEVQSQADVGMIGYRPVQAYLNELEDLYSNHILFFHDEAAGTVIAALWNPSSTAPRPFKVNLSYSTQQREEVGEDDGDTIQLDKSAILAEIARLGGDMVSRIEVRN